MQKTAKHFNVVKNGKLTIRVQSIIDRYKNNGVDVVKVFELERMRLNDKLITAEVFEDSEYGKTLEPVSYIKAKIQALTEILSVLNS